MIDHLAVQVRDVGRSVDFYTSVFEPMGLVEVLRRGPVVALGRDFPFLWFGPASGEETRELHIALAADSRAVVDAVHGAAVAYGAEILHEPRIWPEYHGGYHGVFLRDPDGHNVEAVFHDWSVASGGGG